MVNQDFTKRITIDSAKETWHKSPSDGVERLYLERDDGGESAVATSIVRFAPGSKFDKHIHDGGEEFQIMAPDLFRNSWIDQVVIEDLEVQPMGLYAIEFDDEGTIDVWFVPIRPGNFDFWIDGYENRGLAGTFEVR